MNQKLGNEIVKECKYGVYITHRRFLGKDPLEIIVGRRQLFLTGFTNLLRGKLYGSATSQE
jgi:hypothetical protein